MSYIIKPIVSTETYLIRQPVLRPGKPIESCLFDGDDLNTTFHLGIYGDNKLIGVSSFFKNNQPLIKVNSQYQLRGMALLHEYQGFGLGNRILAHGENLLKQQNIQVIWCNARETATRFYEKNNYKIIGNAFNIENVGIHYMMFKPL